MKQSLVRAGAIIILALFTVMSPSLASSKADAGIASRDEVRRIVIQEAMRSRSVAPALALAVAKVESDYQADAESTAGARGVMQLMPSTARGEFGVAASDLWEPRLNVQLGIAFLDDLLDRYNGRVDLALSHYNGGSGVRKSGVDRILPATRPYVRRVMRLFRHNRSDAEVTLLVRQEGKTNPSLRVELASRKVRPGPKASEEWRHYLDLAAAALEEADRRTGADRNSGSETPSSAEALIQLIESTKSRFRQHLGARAG